MTSPGVTVLPLTLVISTVANPLSPVRRDLLSTFDALLEMAAKHLATITSGDSPVAKSFDAASLKK
jgi:hypothetical protein